jgi:NSS family neurotransmitter:Na+ symporter
VTVLNGNAHGQWTSSIGFALAALGSAIGLGNIWRFSYVAGENGGGAFVLVYLAAVVVLGLPLLIAELAIGKETRANAVAAFARITAAAPWRWVGWLGVSAAVAILAYYPVISGWVAGYLGAYLVGDERLRSGTDFTVAFEAAIADPGGALLWTAAVMAMAAAIVAAGVSGGIERASKILMPIFAALLIVLAGYALYFPGSGGALAFIFAPDWAALLLPKTYLAAVGQAFFSIGLAMGIFVTYGGYVAEGERLPRAALTIAAGDVVIAMVAGVMIFAVVFAHGFDPAHGPTLAFIILPDVFAAMPAGRWIAVAFFLLLFVAALTSVIALLEVPVSLVMTKLGWPRPRAALVVAGAIFVLALPAALGYGPLRGVSPASRPLLEAIDHFASNVILPLSGIGIALVAGWKWPAATAIRAAGLAGAAGKLWLVLLRIVIPAVIALVTARGLGWF